MESKAGARISRKAFLQSLGILWAIMLAAGVLTRMLPAGSYTRLEVDGRQMIAPDSYQSLPRPDYPAWRWFTAPVEVLWGPDALVIITIIVFLLMVGASFAVLDQTGLLRSAVGRLVRAFGDRKYLLLLVISFFFMLIGAFFGIFEEVVPLVPLMVALSYSLGWDALVGLGMSILATNMGFSAAITNPFTIGVAQKIAELPLFSGVWFRIPIFLAIYAIFAVFLVRYARKVERDPQASPVYAEEKARRSRLGQPVLSMDETSGAARASTALLWLLGALVLILVILFTAPFVPGLADFSLPLVGVVFLAAGLGAGFLSGASRREVFGAAGQGMAGIAPAIPLILMAASVKHIIAAGSVLDTILYSASRPFRQAGPFPAALLVYLLALLIEFFVASGSAKAFLLMPILLPLADLVGVTRQLAITAYCFGDGFSNLAYPTNPVLLISLGLTVVSYPKWLRWTLPLWGGVLLVTILFLALGVAIRLGPG